MSQNNNESKKWVIPFNIGYDSFQLILKTMFQQKGDQNYVPLDRLISITQLGQGTIRGNMSFLKSINAATGDTKIGFMLTDMGKDYAKAIFANNSELIKTTSSKLIENSHLQSLLSIIEIKGGKITVDDLYDFIRSEGRFADGTGHTGMSGPYASGARTLLHIFKNAGKLPENLEIDAVSEPSSIRPKSIKQSKSIKIQNPKQNQHKSKSNEVQQEPIELEENSLARLSVRGIGSVDITDVDTLQVAESFMNIIKKKLESKEYVDESDHSLNYAECPNCGKIANNLDEVKTSFGFRTQYGKQAVQSWCINCRKFNN